MKKGNLSIKKPFYQGHFIIYLGKHLNYGRKTFRGFDTPTNKNGSKSFCVTPFGLKGSGHSEMSLWPEWTNSDGFFRILECIIEVTKHEISVTPISKQQVVIRG